VPIKAPRLVEATTSFLPREAERQKLQWSFCRPNARAAGSRTSNEMGEMPAHFAHPNSQATVGGID
jgi:hypothetical protein